MSNYVKYWNLKGDGIIWEVEPGKFHVDSIEMSGLYCDCIVAYGVDPGGELILAQKNFYPMLRKRPNTTKGTHRFELAQGDRVQLMHDGMPVTEYPVRFALNGVLTVQTRTDVGLQIQRTLFPSVDKPFAIEKVCVTAARPIELTCSRPETSVLGYERGVKGVYVDKIYHTAPQAVSLEEGQTLEYFTFCAAEISNRELTVPDGNEELLLRQNRVTQLCDDALVLQTENPELDQMTRFAKLRAGESIFETLTGKYHSPGGVTYYAATWCNDQIEYAGPHQGMTGDATQIEAAINGYKMYIPFMSDKFYKLPSSIIAEGLDIWEGAGDRGDAAMYLYGASLFCLYLGDEKVARELYPAIRWCAEYCQRKKLPQGVISSDSDELEGRIPTDKVANLSTSSLCYGGLVFASKLANALGDTEMAQCYQERARDLGEAIESYFGATLHGFRTYRYSKGFDTLRAWICLPLCVGIQNRAEDTLDAMLSPYLWVGDGMLSCERSGENTKDTTWDRSTLYGMKSAFLCGKGDRMLEHLLDYCHSRLLCERVPYAVEAFPEGAKKHLSAESALFVRLITEGLFAIQPESLTSFSFIPQYFEDLGPMKLSKIHISGGTFEIAVGKDSWTVSCDGKSVAQGATNGQRVVIQRPER